MSQDLDDTLPDHDAAGQALRPKPAQPAAVALGHGEVTLFRDYATAEAGQSAALAHVAGRLGALDDRLKRGPNGWRHRLALIEAAELGWLTGDRIGQDRLALWLALRLAGVQQDTAALGRLGWAARRLSAGPGPQAGLSEFLGRADGAEAHGVEERDAFWALLLSESRALHPITQACLVFHALAEPGAAAHPDASLLEAAVTASRLAATGGAAGDGALFAPLAMGGARGLPISGPPGPRLLHWLERMQQALVTAMRQLDRIEDWEARAAAAMRGLSGRTPSKLRRALVAWPMLSAPMAEAQTGASRAAVQRNLAWMERERLILEITGQGRFRYWRAAI